MVIEHPVEELNLVMDQGKFRLLNAPMRTVVTFDHVSNPAIPVRIEGQTIAVGTQDKVLVYAIRSADLRRRIYNLDLLYEMGTEAENPS